MTGAARIVFVVAVADNGVIGRDGQLPWRMPSDLKWFRRRTLGKPLIMGRRTYESIGKPLDQRESIVLTRSRNFTPVAGVHVVASLDAALSLGRKLAAQMGVDEIAIIGGAEVFAAALPHADRIYLTQVHGAPEGDVRLPPFPSDVWVETAREAMQRSEKDQFLADFITLDRKH